ncbi:hypothetical protein M422DRAFT_232253 [Sphaerobolus stellatus SS14]|uniref:6-methylsalicylate decarboxylase n=1 Tax=Sphaerobolus stellatus (strain SS14) TaxID=990650 RepID=A0A0C9UPH1_SPHS4|nr:hypothetical protein M422DRAFT_232253 [Sphaerobolus stellatus SS14]
MSSPRRIDVHHHFIPPSYRTALEANGGDPSGWHIPEWTVEVDQKFKGTQGIETAILSMTAPGSTILKDPKESAKLARDANEFTAKIVKANPKHFGFFASLPSLLDTEHALTEIAYALDVLKADGVTLFTRYGDDNHYLGHPDFIPVWDELDRRGAVVFIHPTHSVNTHLVNSKLPQPVIDYPHETARTAVDLIISNTVRTHPNVKIILSHAGGTLPYLISRAAMVSFVPALAVDKTYEEIVEDASSFYFDLALSGNKYTLGLLTEFAKPGHILYGSDHPYAPNAAISRYTEEMDSYLEKKASAEELNRGNALKLFPRLSTA